MVKEQADIQILLEIALNQRVHGEAETNLEQIINLYMRKLNSYAVAIFRQESLQMIRPAALARDSRWKEKLELITDKVKGDKKDPFHIHDRDGYVYALPLDTYGWLVLFRKEKLGNNMFFELEKVVYQLGKDLCQYEKDQRIKLLQALFDRLPDALQIIDENGKLYHINKTAASRLGITPEDALNYSVHDRKLLSKGYAGWNERFRELEEKKELTIEETSLDQLTGKPIPVEITEKLTEIGSERFIISISKDISKRKLAERSLHESLERYDDLISKIPVGIYILWFRANGKMEFEYVSDRWCEIKQISRQAVLTDAMQAFDLIHPDDRENFMTRNKLAKQDVKPFLWEGKMVTGKGDLRWIRIESTPRKFENGDIRWIGMMQDISDRKQTQKAFYHLSAMQAILMKIASDYINIDEEKTDEAIHQSLQELGEFVDADRVYIFEYDWKRNVCNNSYEWCQEGVTPEIHNLKNIPLDFIHWWVDSHKLGKELYIEDVMALPEDDEVRNILEPQGIKSLIALPLMDKDNCIGFVGFDSVKSVHRYSEDETNLLRLFSQMLVNIRNRTLLEKHLIRSEKKALQASKAKSEFLANMSHEIRTPLNGVIGFTDLLLKTPLNDLQREYCEYSISSGKALLEIVDNILDFSKIEAGKLELEFIETDLVTLIQQSADMIRYQADFKQLELLLNIQNDMPRLAMLDPYRLKQILINLLSNAVKFTEKGEVELKVTFSPVDHRRGKYHFVVKDTGIGISEKQQQKLFKAFSQADSSNTRKYGGTGLGLIISNLLAEKMGSTIQMNSTPDQGSAFYFTIETDFKHKKAKSRTFSPELLSLRNVLLIDDNTASRTIVENMFNHWNIGFRGCNNGLEALKLLEKYPCDLLIVDYRLAGTDGLSTIRQIREKSGVLPEELPVILLHSTTEEEKLHKQCKKLGIRKNLTKPVKADELYDAVIKIVNKGTESPDESVIHQNTTEKVKVDRGMADSPVILVAEDIALNMKLVKALIKKFLPNAMVLEADNGKRAVESVMSQKVDMVLMDIQMPVMDGLEATRKIRDWESENKLLNHLPIVALTAGAMKQEQQKAFEAGIDEYLTKPLDPLKLQACIQTFLLEKEPVNK